MADRRHVAVLGGGPAGLASALALRQRGYRVTVLEKSHYRSLAVGEHLGAEARPLLSQLGCPGALLRDHARPCPQTLSVWGSDRPRTIDSLFHPYGDGMILRRPTFDRRLAAFAEDRGARVLTGTRLIAHSRRGRGWRLTCRRGTAGKTTALQADFLVDASGHAAVSARSRGGSREVVDRLVGLVAYLEPGRDDRASDDRRLLVEAREEGWWYAAPLPDGRMVATFMTDSDLVARSPGRPGDFWRRRLARSEHTRARLEGWVCTGGVHVRCARSQILDRMVRPGWLAVGDAAMSFDPLSSRGLHKGLDGGVRCARAVDGFFSGDRDALSQFQDDARETFSIYQGLRSKYYLLERRWASSPFWRRRHSPRSAPSIWLHPEHLLDTVLGARLDHVSDPYACRLYHATVQSVGESPLPAHRLVRALARHMEGVISHRQIVLTIQHLIEKGLLCAAGSGVGRPRSTDSGRPLARAST